MRSFHLQLAAVILAVSIGQNTTAQIQYPSGTEDFEAMPVGQDVADIGWIVVNDSDPTLFTVRATDQPSPRPGSTSTRWLRSDDQNPANVQNRWYSPAVTAPQPEDYTWTWHIRLENTPPGGTAVRPKLTIQHLNGSFANAWGIDFTDTAANLIVLGVGGPAASTPLFSLVSPTGIGDWIKLELSVDFDDNTVSASVNDGPEASLSINLTGDKEVFRFCYRGEGTGNQLVMLVDDVSVAVGAAQVIPTTSHWGLLVLTMLLATGAKIHSRRRVIVGCVP